MDLTGRSRKDTLRESLQQQMFSYPSHIPFQTWGETAQPPGFRVNSHLVLLHALLHLLQKRFVLVGDQKAHADERLVEQRDIKRYIVGSPDDIFRPLRLLVTISAPVDQAMAPAHPALDL